MLFVFLLVLPTGALLARYFKEIVGAKWIKVCVFLCVSVCVYLLFLFSNLLYCYLRTYTWSYTEVCLCVSVCARVPISVVHWLYPSNCTVGLPPLSSRFT